MIFMGSVITTTKDRFDDVFVFVKEFSPNVEVYTSDKGKCQIVVSIEAETKKDVESISEKLNVVDGVTDVAHHYAHFGDDGDGPESRG